MFYSRFSHRDIQSATTTVLQVVDGAVAPVNPFVAGPITAYQASRQRTGEKTPTFLAGTTATSTAVIGSRLLGLGIRAALPWVPALGGTIAGAALLSYPIQKLYRNSLYVFRHIHGLDQKVRRLETGERYIDTQTAMNLQLAAVRDMSSALSRSRAYLGREAELFHS